MTSDKQLQQWNKKLPLVPGMLTIGPDFISVCVSTNPPRGFPYECYSTSCITLGPAGLSDIHMFVLHNPAYKVWIPKRKGKSCK